MTVPLLADSNSLFVAEEVFTLFAGKVGKINLSKAKSMAKDFFSLRTDDTATMFLDW